MPPLDHVPLGCRRLTFDRHRHRQPEGRRRKDHDGHQPGRRPGHARPPDAPRSTSTRRPTRRSRYLDVRALERSMYDVLPNGDAARGRDRALVASSTSTSRPSRISLAKLEAQLVGEIDGHFRLKDRLDALERPLRVRHHRHAAGAGPHHRQRAGGGDAPADPGAVELLRARGDRRPAGDRGEDPLAARTPT